MVCELSVIIKNSEKTLKNKFLVYDLIQLSPNDPFIKQCIDVTLKNFSSEPEKIIVKIHLEIF
jgi:hypothetical protein